MRRRVQHGEHTQHRLRPESRALSRRLRGKQHFRRWYGLPEFRASATEAPEGGGGRSRHVSTKRFVQQLIANGQRERDAIVFGKRLRFTAASFEFIRILACRLRERLFAHLRFVRPHADRQFGA